MRFDTPYVLDLSAYIRDVDTPLEAVTLQASPTRFIQVHGFIATLLYPKFLLPNATYDLPATFYVNDTELSANHRIFVHVSDNRPPILQRPLPDVRFDEDTVYAAYRLSSYFSDPDSAVPLTFSVTGVHVKGDIARLLSVAERTRGLFGKDESESPSSVRKKKTPQLQLGFVKPLSGRKIGRCYDTLAG